MNSSKPARFVFLHVPKTGGKTLRHIIYRQYRNRKALRLKGEKETQKFLNLSAGEKNELQLISGHFSFSGAFTFSGPTDYFTMLRDPKKRVISGYNFLNWNPRHAFYKDMVANNYSLLDMLTQGHVANFDNGMVRFLSGTEQKAFGTINQSDCDKAIENFDTYFTHFGINEYFDESILMVSYELGWAFPYYARINTTDKKKITTIDDPATLEALQRCIRYDQQLYDHALAKFRLKLTHYKHQLSADLIKLNEGNKKRNLFLKLHYALFKRQING